MDEDGFIRQRRNLIVVSIILIFADALQFKFSELNLLGNKVVIDHAVSVSPFLWVAWAYLLLRFWQVCKNDQRFKFNAEIGNYIYGHLLRVATTRATDDCRSEPMCTRQRLMEGSRSRFPQIG